MGSRRLSAPLAAVPALYLVILVLIATWWQGAFDIRRWAPLALFGLAALLGVSIRGGLRVAPRSMAVAVGALWLFAVWGLLSATWAASPGAALEDAARAALYASMFSVVLLTLRDRTSASAIGRYLVVGLGLIALYTLVRLHADGESMFLAGRLDGPVNYRNGTACLFGVVVWPALGYAARRGTNPVIRAAGFSVALLSVGLAFLTQSRGVFLGLAVSLLVIGVAGPDRVRRLWLAVLVGIGLAAASGSLLAPYDASGHGVRAAPAADIATAANALTLLTVIGFAVMFLLATFDGGLRPASEGSAVVRVVARLALAAGAVAAVAALLIAIGNPVSYTRDKVHEFTRLDSNATGATRLTSTGGQRYDVWRVALDEFRAHPIEGVGLDGFSLDYYAQRRTDRNLKDPHSLPMKLLAETGIVGFGLFAAFIAALVAVGVTRWRRLPPDSRRQASALAAAGVAVMAQASVDWLWTIPGVIGLGFVCLALYAVLVTAQPEPEPVRPPARPLLGRWLPAAGAVLAILVVVAVYSSDVYVRKARAETAADARLSAARTAHSLDPWSMNPLYLEASALEDQGNLAAARGKLEDARRLEPQNFVPLALLGDFEARRGNKPAAVRLYRQALARNPRDSGLRKLASGHFGG